MSLVDSLVRLNTPVNQNTYAQKIYGVMVGIVTDTTDPDKLGRVKVKLPGREPFNGNDLATTWARIATLMGGNSRGAFFPPEVDDEVLVAFDGGDADKPYVIGMLWNKTDKPPEENADGKNDIRKIKSRSGHEITFYDKSGEEKLEVKSKDGHTVLLDDKNKKIEIKDKDAKNKITIDANSNEITLTGDAKSIVKSKSCSVTVDGTGNSVTIDSGLDVKINGANIAIKSSGMLNIEASGILTLKGSMVKIN